jgi:hypothetical protein
MGNYDKCSPYSIMMWKKWEVSLFVFYRCRIIFSEVCYREGGGYRSSKVKFFQVFIHPMIDKVCFLQSDSCRIHSLLASFDVPKCWIAIFDNSFGISK